MAPHDPLPEAPPATVEHTPPPPAATPRRKWRRFGLVVLLGSLLLLPAGWFGGRYLWAAHHLRRAEQALARYDFPGALEELEQSVAAADAADTRTPAKPTPSSAPVKRQVNRGALPAHLPRIETVIEPAERTCPCCHGAMHRIGEDVAERLDIVPAKLRVLVVRRPRYACRACPGTLVQAPACWSLFALQYGRAPQHVASRVVASTLARRRCRPRRNACCRCRASR